MSYRQLSTDEINQLKNQGCTAEHWEEVLVHPDFTAEHIERVSFSGKVKLGVFSDTHTFPGGVKRHSGIRNATIHSCEIGDNACIDNIQGYIAGYTIGRNVVIQNLHLMYVEGNTAFGNGVEVAVMNETGGREVMINDKLSAHFAYILASYRHRPKLVKKLQELVHFYSSKHAANRGTVGDNVEIINAGVIKNVKIGSHAVIEGIKHLENGSINSNGYDPIYVGYNVIAQDFIISSGSRVDNGVMLKRCFVGQACHLGQTYSATDSLFFSNCQGENGEACSIFAGPYTVTHHKSTLLISGMFSFMNAGSGSNQSNHMYKLGPIHQGVVERGGKTTSDSYILWPARIGAFSLIMGRHYRHSDTSNMPFSYLIENNDESILVPGINLRSVGTIRDAQKFPKRDNRKDPNRLDKLNFNLLSPYTVQKMFRAVEILKELQRTCGETTDTYTYQSCRITNPSLTRGLKLYDMAICKFLGNSIISRLEKCSFSTSKELRSCLEPDADVGLGEWYDLAGLIAPGSEVDRLLEDIESGRICRIKEINAVLENLHARYYSLEWTWAWDKIRQYYGVSLDTITAADVIGIVERWKEAVVDLDKLIYEDAKKEFSLSSHIGFGLDGSATEQKIDFAQVRGVFEKNSFVEAVLKHIAVKTKLGNDMIERLRKV